MKTRNLLTVVIALISTMVFSQEKIKELSPAEKEARRYQKTGGHILKKGTFTGKVLILDTQSKISFDNIKTITTRLASATECNIVLEKGENNTPEKILRKYVANAVVIVIDDKNQPTMLVAPEDRWAMVNVAKLVDDLPSEKAKQKFIESRARKEILRAFSLLCGGGSSQFPGNSMNCATIRELDFAVETIPVDMINYYQQYLKRLGVTQKEFTTYRRACREGWAPAPTNDIQKAIWEKVHSVPKNPMKIEFDPKKGR